MYPMTITSETIILMPATQTLQQYAAATNTHPRTVKRWLADDLLPGAIKDPDTGLWSIPVGARRTPKEQVALPHRPPARTEIERVVVPEPDNYDLLGTFLSLERALKVINKGVPEEDWISRYALTENAEYFGLVKVGHKGKWLMPLSTIKRLRGL